MNTELKYSDTKASAHSPIYDIKIYLLYMIFHIIIIIMIMIITMDYSANVCDFRQLGEKEEKKKSRIYEEKEEKKCKRTNTESCLPASKQHRAFKIIIIITIMIIIR